MPGSSSSQALPGPKRAARWGCSVGKVTVGIALSHGLLLLARCLQPLPPSATSQMTSSLVWLWLESYLRGGSTAKALGRSRDVNSSPTKWLWSRGRRRPSLLLSHPFNPSRYPVQWRRQLRVSASQYTLTLIIDELHFAVDAGLSTVNLLARALHRIRSTPPRIIASPATREYMCLSENTPAHVKFGVEPRRAAVALLIRVVPSPTFSAIPPRANPPTLNEFFELDWVKDPAARTEILFLRREKPQADEALANNTMAKDARIPNEAHVAFPGGRAEDGDEGGLYTGACLSFRPIGKTTLTLPPAAMRQTWEEIGIDLAERDYECIGQLDDREITTSLGKRLLMILSPFGSPYFCTFALLSCLQSFNYSLPSTHAVLTGTRPGTIYYIALDPPRFTCGSYPVVLCLGGRRKPHYPPPFYRSPSSRTATRGHHALPCHLAGRRASRSWGYPYSPRWSFP